MAATNLPPEVTSTTLGCGIVTTRVAEGMAAPSNFEAGI